MTEFHLEIVWTDYMKYRAGLRRLDIARIEYILRCSGEQYLDTVTNRHIKIGRVDDLLVMIPYDSEPGSITPVTVHATTRQQINFRLKTGRFINE